MSVSRAAAGMFYINWSIQANLSQCALRKYDCFRLELSTRGAPVGFMHVPQFCACTLSRLCWEYRRPQWAATVRCLEWADVYSPPYRVLKDMGWHVTAEQAAYALAFPHRGDTMTAKSLGKGLWTAGLDSKTIAENWRLKKVKGFFLFIILLNVNLFKSKHEVFSCGYIRNTVKTSRYIQHLL